MQKLIQQRQEHNPPFGSTAGVGIGPLLGRDSGLYALHRGSVVLEARGSLASSFKRGGSFASGEIVSAVMRKAQRAIADPIDTSINACPGGCHGPGFPLLRERATNRSAE